MSLDHMRAMAERYGSEWFTPGAMKAFNSRVLESTVTPIWNHETGEADHNLGYWFVSSEKMSDTHYWNGSTYEFVEHLREYSVRRGAITEYRRESDGRICYRFDVELIGERHATRQQATKAMRQLVADEKNNVS